MSYSAAEVKSGFLVTVSLVLLIVLTFIVGGFSGQKTKTWQIRFGYVNGLGNNAPVYFGGHEVGKVDRIEVRSGEERVILLTVAISDKIQLREDTQAFVDTLGLMGEKFVELTPGSIQKPVLKDGTMIEGTDPIPMYLLVRKMNVLADRMDEMTATLNPMMKHMDTMVSGHEEEIAKTVTNLHEVSANIRDMTHDLKYHPWRLVRKG